MENSARLGLGILHFAFFILHLNGGCVQQQNMGVPFSSLWCGPVNMPASHAGDHRSEAGQGRQFGLDLWIIGLLAAAGVAPPNNPLIH